MAGVPQFGNWENDGSVPYTQYFERARKGKGGAKAINSSNPQEANGSISSDAPPIQASPARTKANPNPAKAADFSAPYENASRNGGTPGGSQLRAHKTSTRSDRSVENSPLNLHTPGRFTDKGGSASPWQSRAQSERSHDVASTTPGRPRMQQSDEMPEKVTAVPKFGDWDENDPSGGAVYTEVFRRVKEEKKNPSSKAPYIMTEPQYNSSPRPGANSGSWFWCFGKPSVAH